jgi:diacylglycerol kinase family enzyme
MLTVGNGMAIGGGIKMCPLAKIDDDYLDFTCINKFPRIKVIPALKAAMDGKVLKLRFVKSVKCKTIEIKIPNAIYQRDGTIVRGESEMKISLAKEKINFIG